MHTILNLCLRRTTFLVVSLLVVCSARPLHAQQDAPPTNDPLYKVTSKRSNMKLVERFAKILELKNNITSVYGFDPEVISVTPVDKTPNQIRIQAESSGVTTLILADSQKQIFLIEILVDGDVRHLQAQLKELFPTSSVKVTAVGDESVVLQGWVTQPENISRMVNVAQQHYGEVLNQMQVGGIQQVQLKVKVMEIQRSKIRQLGFNFLYLNQQGFVASTPGQLVNLANVAAPFGGPPGIASSIASLAGNSVQGAITADSTVFQGFLEALKQESLLKILAEPKLITTNGRPASMLAGGEFPILVPQSLGTTTIEWRSFGVTLEAVPIILGNGRVRLELQPEVSERDFTNSVNTGGVTVPGLTTRRVNTQVEMRFGETFILAGLLSMRNTAETSKVPILGEIPWLGAAFSRVRYDETETELVIMVTPNLVSPFGAGQVPPGGPGSYTDIPTDRELYIERMIEVPNYGDRCEGCITPITGTIETTTTYPDPSTSFTKDRIERNGPFLPSTGSNNGMSRSLPPTQNYVPGESTTKSNTFTDRIFKWATALKPSKSKTDSPSVPTRFERPRQSNFKRRDFEKRAARSNKQQTNFNSFKKSQSTGSSDKPGRSGIGRTRFQLIDPQPGLIQP
jgi:pilus assembly protein CpaC